jgi:hypothetical protein
VRTLAFWGLLAALVGPRQGPDVLRIAFMFDREPRWSSLDRPMDADIEGQRETMGAWADSVDGYLDRVALDARDDGWARARRDEDADYRVLVTALPVLVRDRAPNGLTAYSLVLFERASGDWRYVDHYVGYGARAEEAARRIFRTATDAIAARNPNAGRVGPSSFGRRGEPAREGPIEIANQQLRIAPNKLAFFQFDLPTGSCQVAGQVQGLPGGALNFEALVTNPDGLQALESHRNPLRTWWRSGPISSTTFNLDLTGPGTYVLVVNNAFSGPTWKTVVVRATAQCSPNGNGEQR